MKTLLLSVAVASSACVSFAEIALIRNGLVYNLDASVPATVITDEFGNVMSWRSNSGDADVTFTGGTIDGYDKKYYPWYDPTGYQGLGQITFGRQQEDHAKGWSSWMTGVAADGRELTNRTLLVVCNYPGGQANGVIWGVDGAEYNAHSYASTSGQRLSYVGFVKGATYLNVNGTDYTQSHESDYVIGSPQGRMVCVAAADHVCTVANLGRSQHSYNYVERNSSVKGAPNYSANYNTNTYFRGSIAQVVVYDRALSTDECKYLITAMTRKWVTQAGKTVRWVGKGDGTSWSDGANWSTGRVPQDGEVAEICTASVSVSGDIACYDLELSDATLTIPAGAKLSVSNSLCATGSTTLDIGGRLALNKIDNAYREFGGTPSFAFRAGGVLAKIGFGALAFPKDNVVTGEGTLSFESGTLDLNGTTQSASSIVCPSDGCNRVMVNTAAQKGVLTLASESDVRMVEGYGVIGDIDIVRTGSGKISLGGRIATTAGVYLQGGETVAPDTFVPESISGLVVHVDASYPGSVETNADGTVVAWHSVCSTDGTKFYYPNPNRGDRFQATVVQPKYQGGGLGGLPAIAFGSAAYPEWSTSNGWLCLNRSVTTRSYAIVYKTGSFDRNGTIIGCNRTEADSILNVYQFGTASYYEGKFIVGYNYVNQPTGAVLSVRGEVIFDENSPLLTSSSPKIYGQFDSYMPTCLAASTRYGYQRTAAPYLAFSNGAYFHGWISEVCLFDRILSEAERRGLEKYLMAKWKLTPLDEDVNCRNMLGAGTNLVYALTGGATLNLNSTTQTVAKVVTSGSTVKNGTLVPTDSLETAVDVDGSYGALSLEGDVDLTELAFTFSGGKPKVGGTVLESTGTVLGPFRAVDGKYADQMRYRLHKVKYGQNGLMVIFR